MSFNKKTKKLFGKGIIAQREGDDVKAIEFFKKTLDYDPN